MALTRTLEMLKAGERINDLLYRSTVNGSRQPLARRLAALGATRSVRVIRSVVHIPRTHAALDPSRG
jgi:hypothetical protein